VRRQNPPDNGQNPPLKSQTTPKHLKTPKPSQNQTKEDKRRQKKTKKDAVLPHDALKDNDRQITSCSESVNYPTLLRRT
jgi:hypothetical protein